MATIEIRKTAAGYVLKRDTDSFVLSERELRWLCLVGGPAALPVRKTPAAVLKERFGPAHKPSS